MCTTSRHWKILLSFTDTIKFLFYSWSS